MAHREDIPAGATAVRFGYTTTPRKEGSPVIETLFRPRGIAVAGASRYPTKPGHQVLHNLLAAGYPGQIALVHPEAQSILGVPAYPALEQVPTVVEMLILAAPAASTPAMAESVVRRKQTRGDLAVVVSLAGGFAESATDEGRRHQEMLAAACREAGVRLLGPNCLGVMDARNRLDTTFLTGTRREPSGISLLSQSGALIAWVTRECQARPHPIGLNKFISVGNMADLSLHELLDFLGRDPSTRAIGLYLEALPATRPLLEAARRVALRKPVVVLKSGRTPAGARAAYRHTGSVSDGAPFDDEVARQHGLLPVERVDEFVTTLATFDRLPLPLGNRVAVLTNSGGAGVYALDALARHGIAPARLSPPTAATLRRMLPPFAVVGDPEGYVDSSAGAGPRQTAQAIAALLRDPGVDAVVQLFVPMPFSGAEEMARDLLQLLPGIRRNSLHKPLFPVLLGGGEVLPARRLLEENGFMTFASPEEAATALDAMLRYAQARQRLSQALMR